MYHETHFLEAERKAKKKKPRRPGKVHTRTRACILKENLVPLFLKYKEYVVWDGYIAIRTDDPEWGKNTIACMGGVGKELQRMVLAGEFGEIPNLLIHSGLWWLCRDELLWPVENSKQNVERFKIAKWDPAHTE